ASAVESLPERIRETYFDRNGSQYAFRSDMRRRIIFGRHDITTEAPISRLNLLVWRNTLMYFNVEAQAQIIDRFHFALREGAYLFLGKAEMLLSDGDRFEAASMRQRIFRRRPGGNAARPGAVRLVAKPVTEPQVAVSRAISSLAVEAAPFAMICVDADGVVAEINGQARSRGDGRLPLRAGGSVRGGPGTPARGAAGYRGAAAARGGAGGRGESLVRPAAGRGAGGRPRTGGAPLLR